MTNIQELAVKIDGVLLVLGSDKREVYLSVDGQIRTVRFFTKEDAVEFIMSFDLVKFTNSGNF